MEKQQGTKRKRRTGVEKIEDRKKKNVTFCKRRQGLFKKAAAISNVFKVPIALLVFSPNGDNVYSFGNPSPDQVIDMFQPPSSPPSPPQKIDDDSTAATGLQELETTLLTLRRKIICRLEQLAASSANANANRKWQSDFEDEDSPWCPTQEELQLLQMFFPNPSSPSPQDDADADVAYQDHHDVESSFDVDQFFA